MDLLGALAARDESHRRDDLRFGLDPPRRRQRPTSGARSPAHSRWVDMGSGAGFPGLVIAIQLAGSRAQSFIASRATGGSAPFCVRSARATGRAAQIHAMRVEAVDAAKLGPVDAVTARAFAPLPRLSNWPECGWIEGAIGVFPRGRSAKDQLEALGLDRAYTIEVLPSAVDTEAAILIIRATESPPMDETLTPIRAAGAAGAAARPCHGESEGRRRQDDDRDQSRHGAGGDRRARPHHRPRSPGQCVDRPRHRSQEPRHLQLRHADRRAHSPRRHRADGGAAPLHRAIDHGSPRRRTRDRRRQRPHL